MSHCDDALRKINQSLAAYRQTNADQNPDRLEMLIGIEGLTAWDLVCPVSSCGVGECSYIYRGDDLCEGVDPRMIVAYDKTPVHKGRRNILFADGTVDRIPEKILDKYLKQDNQLRRELNLPEK